MAKLTLGRAAVRRMKRALRPMWLAAVCGAAMVLQAPAQERAAGHGSGVQAETAARSAATSWLRLVDAGKYGESWDEAAAYFRSRVDKAGWQRALDTVRGPLGGVTSRTLQTEVPKASLPGAPDGAYVVMQFGSVFAHKEGAVETVVCMRQTDGRWRVSGYFVK